MNIRRRSSKTRSVSRKEWKGDCANYRVTGTADYFNEVAVSLPDTRDDDTTSYRLLYSVDFWPALDDGGTDTGYNDTDWVSFGVLRCSFDNTNTVLGILTPFEGEPELDGQWLYRYSWPLPTHRPDGVRWNIASGFCQMSTFCPNRQFYFDIPLRRGRGTTTSKREALVLVMSVNSCASEVTISRGVAVAEAWSVLQSHS